MISTTHADLVATVVVPTTGQRADVLKHSIPSILAQSETRIEVKVIGDGAAPETRALVEEFAASDPRVQFIDKPKHPRRGEPYRHEVLQSARGRIVCYLCDRDLMLPNHVAHMNKLLENHDFAHSARIRINADDSVLAHQATDISLSSDRRAMRDARVIDGGIPLSFAAHTLEAYNRLVEGWSRTPIPYYTDGYMWWKFLQSQDIAAVSDNKTMTILFLPRRPKAEWPQSRRADEQARWLQIISTPGWQAPFIEALNQAEADIQLRRPPGGVLKRVLRIKRWIKVRRRMARKIMEHYRGID